MFKRTADVSCSLKESIDGLEIIVCGNKNKITVTVLKGHNVTGRSFCGKY